MKEEIEELNKNYLIKFDEVKKNNQKVVLNLNEEKDKLNKLIEELKSNIYMNILLNI